MTLSSDVEENIILDTLDLVSKKLPQDEVNSYDILPIYEKIYQAIPKGDPIEVDEVDTSFIIRIDLYTDRDTELTKDELQDKSLDIIYNINNMYYEVLREQDIGVRVRLKLQRHQSREDRIGAEFSSSDDGV